ncbi:glutaredoxin 3-like [Ctenocephalides felis]|uniref:glutaredoxin 3-like n=1 Tax=Ctenocephalides felis TaxID=7515 RepID=UPI000E6E4935|nr:glutaredoxin 3-like [Ctenocephalides felis]XP_026473388.1 glutaredoxin 3-like [Ctenocephalides felis]
MVAFIQSVEEFEKCLSEQVSVVLFSDDFAEQCKVIKEGLVELSKRKELSNVKFFELHAESLAKISLQYKVDAVPTTLIFKNKQQIDRVDGANIAEVSTKVLKHGSSLGTGGGGEDIEKRLKSLINQHKVMVFMKGDRTTPRCGFSKTLIGIMNDSGVEYGTFDILTDEVVRQELKTFSDWPTYPQLYVNGELIGGLDIVKELVQNNEFKDVLKG